MEGKPLQSQCASLSYYRVGHSSLDSIWLIKSRRIKWAGYVAYTRRHKMHTGFWWGNLKANLQGAFFLACAGYISTCMLEIPHIN
jgi:hypothetical protein